MIFDLFLSNKRSYTKGRFNEIHATHILNERIDAAYNLYSSDADKAFLCLAKGSLSKADFFSVIKSIETIFIRSKTDATLEYYSSIDMSKNSKLFKTFSIQLKAAEAMVIADQCALFEDICSALEECSFKFPLNSDSSKNKLIFSLLDAIDSVSGKDLSHTQYEAIIDGYKSAKAKKDAKMQKTFFASWRLKGKMLNVLMF